MAWQVKGVRGNGFRHHFVQYHTIRLMCFLLGLLNLRQLVRGVQCMSPFVKCEVFIGVIRDKYVNWWLAFDLVNAINYVNVWILSFGSSVVCKEVCHMGFDNGCTYLDWYDTIVSGWYFESWFNCSLLLLCNYRIVCKLEIYHSFVYSNFFPYPKHKIMKTSVYQWQKWVLFQVAGHKLWRHVGFSFCLIYVLVVDFLYNRIYFFRRHKLLQILLIWLHLVYGKMFFLIRHLGLMVSEEKNFLHNIIF